MYLYLYIYIYVYVAIDVFYLSLYVSLWNCPFIQFVFEIWDWLRTHKTMSMRITRKCIISAHKFHPIYWHFYCHQLVKYFTLLLSFYYSILDNKKNVDYVTIGRVKIVSFQRVLSGTSDSIDFSLVEYFIRIFLLRYANASASEHRTNGKLNSRAICTIYSSSVDFFFYFFQHRSSPLSLRVSLRQLEMHSMKRHDDM